MKGTVYCPVVDTINTPKSGATNISVFITANGGGPNVAISAARCFHYWWQAGGGCGTSVNGFGINATAFQLTPAQTGDLWQNTTAELGYIMVKNANSQLAQLGGYQAVN
jgi:hypothetical protein